MSDNSKQDALVELAKNAVEEFVQNHRTAHVPEHADPDLSDTAGVFVCLKRDGQLRGCIGTIEPTQPNLGAEIVQNAISAASRDPRFQPIRPQELADLEYSVDVLQKPEQIYDLRDLDPKVYGVIAESGYKRGLLLPDLEGVDTVEDQVGIAMQKGGIRPGEPVTLYRFKVIRHGK
jgi:AmmeMemoRadiSam system protein A